MFKKLQKEILLMNMSLISLVMILAFVSIYFSTWQNVRTENLNKLNAQFPLLISNIGGFPPRPPVSSASYELLADYSFSFLVEIDKDGNILNVGSVFDIRQELCAQAVYLALAREKSVGEITLDGKNWMYQTEDFSRFPNISRGRSVPQNGRYISFLDITESKGTMRSLLATLSFVGITVLAVFYFISLYFSRRAVKPIAQAWEKQKQFVADASHELKTPLTIINANCDALSESKTETVESQMKWLNYIRVGTDRMSNLIGQLLMLAKMDDDISADTTWERVDASMLALETVRSMSAVAREKNISLTYDIEPGIIIKSDGEKISAIMSILLDNSLKYCESNIKVVLEKTKRHIYFKAQNDGRGICPEDLPRIFDRFYRGEKSRAGNESYGLGLSIAKAFAESLNGKISAESKPCDHTVVTVCLPL